jgi:phosphopantothenoylcysteine decarboxylase/phosphopantothenate--cysteine ligase
MNLLSLTGKKILLGVTGSIAAYKAVVLVRLLIKGGAEVKVIMTKTAAAFVSPLTFSTLSKNKVLTELFDNESWANHVMLGRWADIMVIAPASCNTIAKMANGICDNLLLSVYFSATCPVFIAPSMDEDMWKHPSTKRNIKSLIDFDNKILPVNRGDLASGLVGEGRMAEPEEVQKHIENYFKTQKSLTGLKALVTAGPTYEAIDPVRYIGNRSTGTMGVSIAQELADRGAEVELIIGPSEIDIPLSVTSIKVVSAKEMYDAVMHKAVSFDIIIMSAAVADYTIENPSFQKIKKEDEVLSLKLVKTQDIMASVGAIKNKHQTLVGFALETNNEKENAIKKLNNKNADMVILNSLKDEGAGFGKATNKISIFDKKGNEFSFDKKSKKEVARDIINTIIQYRNV